MSEIQIWISIYLAVGMFVTNDISETAVEKAIAIFIWPVFVIHGLIP